MFAKESHSPKGKREVEPIHRAGLLTLRIMRLWNGHAEARGLCNYYNLACDYHTLDYFCYLMDTVA